MAEILGRKAGCAAGGQAILSSGSLAVAICVVWPTLAEFVAILTLAVTLFVLMTIFGARSLLDKASAVRGAWYHGRWSQFAPVAFSHACRWEMRHG